MANPTYFTEKGLQTIEEAIQTGTLSVYYGDKRVEYRSLNDMIRIRNLILDALGKSVRGSGRSFAEFNKGVQRQYGIEGDLSEDNGCWENQIY